MTGDYDAPISRGASIGLCVLAVFIVLLAGVIEEGPKWIAKTGFMLERMETATEQALFPELKPGTIASTNIDWLRSYHGKKRVNLPIGIFETAEGWYITEVIEKTDDGYVKLKIGGPNDFSSKIWIKEEVNGEPSPANGDGGSSGAGVSSPVWSAPEGI